MKFAIYIPAYNAEKTVTLVLQRIPPGLKEAAAEIFVIDNCSSDKTGEVATQYGRTHGLKNLTVIRNERNEGYGGSQKIAYQRCIEKGYDCVAMLHGDAQYAPELLETLFEPVLARQADLVFGSRMQGNPLKGGMPLIRFLGNRVLTTIQNIFLGQTLSEYHSGYRVYSVEALRQLPLNRLSSDYHFDTEIIILFVHQGLKITERPIPTHYGDEENYVNIWKYGTDVLVSTLTYWLHQVGLRKSRGWTRILTGEEGV
ncbi:MAG: glycosyltransferase family 2 protein [Oligoflexia bacterium]|nr:glycosyltransferase family 2 protein [Oligoflexia bacterium]